jgi:hypothetical protein
VTNEGGFSRAGERFIPPPKDFDPLAASPDEMARYGLLPRPDPRRHPSLSVAWEQRARRYRSFQHLQAEVRRTLPREAAMTSETFRLHPTSTCGFSLDSNADPFISLYVTWTVPNLRYRPGPVAPNVFRTFVSLGFLDVHTEMTVDPTMTVTSTVTVLGPNGIEPSGLPVEAGDVVFAGICLGPNPPGRAAYVLSNETSSETVNFGFDSGLAGAFTIRAGISRDVGGNPSLNPLAHFGVAYFDEIAAYTKAGQVRSLTEGQAATMVDTDGATLATPVQLNNSAFKIISSN